MAQPSKKLCQKRASTTLQTNTRNQTREYEIDEEANVRSVLGKR